MLFNLGMTADAAAAHNSDAGGSQSDTQLSSPTHPAARSFAVLPSWGFSGKERVGDVSRPKYEQRRSMPVKPVEHFSSDEERYSSAGPSPARSRFAQQQSAKPSPRSRTSYQLAHPATNARHRRLKLRPKLLLQLQQVSHTTRPVPVLDVLPSTLFMPRFARKFPTILRGKKGLGPNDLIITTSDLYDRPLGDSTTEKSVSSDEENGDHHEVVATICQIMRDDALLKGKAEICLSSGSVWEATPLPNGSYEFAAETTSGVSILRWVRRGARKHRVSAPPGSIPQEDTRRFTFSVVDPNTRRHPVIGSMTRNQLEVYDRYSIPTTHGGPSSPTSAMSVISDASDMEAPIGRPVIETDDNLRMLIIITGIWVAFREGWSPNFSYTDSAVTCKSARSPASKLDQVPIETENRPDKQSEAEHKRRGASWSVRSPIQQVPATTTTERSMKYGSRSRRSNSTGAAFIQRSNQRTSTNNARPNRHSTLATSRDLEHPNVETSPIRQNIGGCRTWPQHRKATTENAKSIPSPTKPPVPPKETAGSQKRPPEPSRAPSDYPPEKSGPTKGKRRHRFSNLFDFIVRRNGNNHD